jgi:anti-sigma regulatory factor (Ser/Thr protein kinase)
VLVLPVTDPSQPGEARRRLVELARAVGLDETDAGRVALVATELATNLVKHIPGGGVLLGQPLDLRDATGIEILALDRGPGMADLARCLQDGYSTGGSSGTGLGAASRLSDLFEVDSAPGVGTAILSHVRARRERSPSRRLSVGGLTVPKPGQEVCGDARAFHRYPDRDRISLMVVDGLGHGPGAAGASQEAVRVFHHPPEVPPAAAIERIHEALKGTRGAAVAIAEIDPSERVVRFAGVGNIAGSIVSPGGSHGLVSHNGTAGAQVRKIQEFTYDWPEGALLVLHSDGLTSRWEIDRRSGPRAREPALLAGILYRDFARGSDDATVAVVGEAASSRSISSGTAAPW